MLTLPIRNARVSTHSHPRACRLLLTQLVLPFVEGPWYSNQTVQMLPVSILCFTIYESLRLFYISGTTEHWSFFHIGLLQPPTEAQNMSFLGKLAQCWVYRTYGCNYLFRPKPLTMWIATVRYSSHSQRYLVIERKKLPLCTRNTELKYKLFYTVNLIKNWEFYTSFCLGIS
jgi:hypothetical protein